MNCKVSTCLPPIHVKERHLAWDREGHRAVLPGACRRRVGTIAPERSEGMHPCSPAGSDSDRRGLRACWPVLFPAGGGPCTCVVLRLPRASQRARGACTTRPERPTRSEGDPIRLAYASCSPLPRAAPRRRRAVHPRRRVSLAPRKVSGRQAGHVLASSFPPKPREFPALSRSPSPGSVRLSSQFVYNINHLRPFACCT